MLGPVLVACICSATRLVAPVDGETAVPTNGAIVLVVNETQPAPPLTLRETASGVEVPLATELIQGANEDILIARPAAGTLAARASHELAIYTMVAATFTTGDAPDQLPPSFDGLVSLAAETTLWTDRDCNSSCVSWRDDRFHRLALGYTLPPDVRWFRLEVQVGAAAPAIIPLIDRFEHPGIPSLIDSSGCPPRVPPVAPGDTVCARLVAYDLAGNTAGADVEACATVVSCAPVINQTSCAPVEGCPATLPDAGPDDAAPDGGDGCGCQVGAGGGVVDSRLLLLVAAAWLLRRGASSAGSTARMASRSRSRWSR